MKNHQEVDSLIDKLKQEIKEEGMLYEEKVFFKEPESAQVKAWDVDPQLHYFFPLASNNKWLRLPVTFVKRLIRKCNRFLIAPIVSEQTDFNKSVKEEIEKMNGIIAKQQARILQLEQQLEQMD